VVFLSLERVRLFPICVAASSASSRERSDFLLLRFRLPFCDSLRYRFPPLPILFFFIALRSSESESLRSLTFERCHSFFLLPFLFCADFNFFPFDFWPAARARISLHGSFIFPFLVARLSLDGECSSPFQTEFFTRNFVKILGFLSSLTTFF